MGQKVFKKILFHKGRSYEPMTLFLLNTTFQNAWLVSVQESGKNPQLVSGGLYL